MAYTVIDKPNLYFNTKLYTGTGSSLANTGVGFQSDLTWIKGRSGATEHVLTDSVRGVTKELSANDNGAEETVAQGLTAFGSDGFTVGTDGSYNTSSATYASWNWLGGGAGSLNEVGSIDSTVSANTTAGFSIVSWTGSGADATIGHGLTQAPTIFFVKNRTDSGTNWRVGQVLTSSNNMTDGNGYYMELDDWKASTNPGSAVTWGATPTAPTSSVFSVGSDNAHNGSSDDMLAYCFHSVKGYSKFGSYTGNGNADGTFIYTGFKPAFIIIKPSSKVEEWTLIDNKRLGYNPDNNYVYPNQNYAEMTNDRLDIVSNGFKIRASTGEINTSGATMIYMAFAENPLVTSTGIPCTAR